jgi:hypothetical protein
MNKGKLKFLILVSAIIWSTVMFGCSVLLEGSVYKRDISFIISGGVIAHIFLIWLPMTIRSGKKSTDPEI